MGTEITPIDRFFLAHAAKRVHKVLNSGRINIQNVAEEFALLAERDPIPHPLRKSYQRVATSLSNLVLALEEAMKDAEQTLMQAEDLMPLSCPQDPPDASTCEAVLRVGKSLHEAEGKTRELLRWIQPDLLGTPWSDAMVHAEAHCVLYLDPGPEFPQYLLEDTDFNLFEEPLSRLGLSDLEGQGAAIPIPSLPTALMELEVRGKWVHDLLSHSCLTWEHFPMVQTVYVDLDLGTGQKVLEK